MATVRGDQLAHWKPGYVCSGHGDLAGYPGAPGFAHGGPVGRHFGSPPAAAVAGDAPITDTNRPSTKTTPGRVESRAPYRPKRRRCCFRRPLAYGMMQIIALVAQLDRASASGAEGCGFDSHPAQCEESVAAISSPSVRPAVQDGVLFLFLRSWRQRNSAARAISAAGFSPVSRSMAR